MSIRFGKIALLASAGLMLASAAPALAQEINLYTYREPGLIKPLLDEFTKETKIKVNTIFLSSGLEERIKAEGANSPADVILTVDIGRLQNAKDLGITQPIKLEALDKAIPATYRDPEGHWYGVSTRGRVVYASKDRVKLDKLTYEELADPKWKGKICIRSGQHLYNVSLIAAVIAHKGEAKAEEWLKGLKANLAKKPSGGDREQAKDILAGVCDIAIGNTYYVALMRNGTNAEQKTWGEAINVVLPTFEGGGTHVNISGVALAKNAPNKADALKFIEFMASDTAQHIHADVNSEYPVKNGIQLNETVASFGQLKPDSLPIAEIAKQRKKASELVDKVGFDQ
ncbi:Fe(3+) ABC transporter substrate-binding protein [Microvirga pudoricolor]|uniref:Fe(3+) ABC transporter substrate-binding protein n=1 Tax=Microvirga pudoricolor TaxID=2778729 RepID=UPI00194E4282|nr:Fe(3+) ABC transporter substrate-binding protein [Microvirga pudoricolor]MBM6594287.1 Fe(3+) ABC transporter substrate-binding protein [Microvirga pudoricolor]